MVRIFPIKKISWDCPLNPNFDRLSPSPILGDFQLIIPSKIERLDGLKYCLKKEFHIIVTELMMTA
jgi:hypothetical protein